MSRATSARRRVSSRTPRTCWRVVRACKQPLNPYEVSHDGVLVKQDAILFPTAAGRREVRVVVLPPLQMTTTGPPGVPEISVRASALNHLQRQIVACRRCSRLVGYCRKVAAEKRARYQHEEYWGKPVPSFGGPAAELLIVGLAPGAHGSNRTGRMFTGDRSGEFLYRALYEAGFANQPEARFANDGLKLRGCYITAVVRCAPPQNKPLPAELRNCQPYFEKELELLTRVRAVLALGRVAFDTYLRIVRQRSAGLPARRGTGQSGIGQASRRLGRHPLVEPEAFPPRASFRFAHGASYQLPPGLPRLFASYHPSQQNTQTGKLTAAMFHQVLDDIRQFLGGGGPSNIEQAHVKNRAPL